MPFGSPVPPFAPRPCLRSVQQMPKVSDMDKKLKALCDNAVQLAGQAVYLQYQGDDLTHVVLGGHLINQTPKQLLKMAGHMHCSHSLANLADSVVIAEDAHREEYGPCVGACGSFHFSLVGRRGG